VHLIKCRSIDERGDESSTSWMCEAAVLQLYAAFNNTFQRGDRRSELIKRKTRKVTSSCPYFYSTCYNVSDELSKFEKEWHVSVIGTWQLVHNTAPRGRSLLDKLIASQQRIQPCLVQRSFTLMHHIRSNAKSDKNLRQHYIFIQLKVKVKVKFSLEQTMKDQRGSRGIALLFL
jgi:hypothetical protein